MISKEKQIKNSLLYILPNIANGLLPILTLPVFTRALSVNDYGVYALASIYGILLSGIVNFGLTVSYERNFFQYKDSRKIAELLYSTLTFVLVAFLVATAFTYLFKEPIARILIGSSEYSGLLFWVFLSTVIMSLKQYFLIYFKNIEKAGDFVVYTLDETLIGVVLSLFFVVYLRLGIIGLALGQCFASTAIFSVLALKFLKTMPFSFGWGVLKDSLKISLPLTPRIFTGVISTQLNKFVLNLLNTLGGVGVFSIAQKIGNMTFVFMAAVQNVFNPQVYKKMFSNNPSAGREIGEYLTPFAYISIFVCMLTSLFSQEVVWLLTGPAFYASAPLISILSMYYGFLFFGKINGIQLIFKKKTFLTSILTFLDIGVGVALSIPFIIKFGVIGAAWATFLGSLITGMVAFLISQHYFHIQWEVRKIAAIFGIFSLSSLLILFVISNDFMYLQCLALKIFCIVVYVYMGVRLRIITAENLKLLLVILTFRRNSLAEDIDPINREQEGFGAEKATNRKYFICKSVRLKYLVRLFIKESLIGRERVALCYMEPNRVSRFIEKIAGSTKKQPEGFLSLFYLDYDFLRMKNNLGIPLIIASMKDDLYQVIDKLEAEKGLLGDPLLRKLDGRFAVIKRELRSYIKQRISMDIFEDLYLINVAHWLSVNKESRLSSRNIALIFEKKDYWSYLSLDFARNKNVKCAVFHSFDLKKNIAVLFVLNLVKICIEIALTLFVKKGGADSSDGAKIGIPFYVSQNFVNLLDLRNYYLFWFDNSTIDPEKILIYSPNSRSNIKDEEVANIRKSGFNIVSGPPHTARGGDGSVPVYRCSARLRPLLLDYIKQIVRMRKAVRNGFLKEQWKIISLLFLQLPYWEDFFRSNNIKIKFRFHDMFSLREIAAKVVGAVTVSYHYSNQSDITMLHQDICDVFFVWGKKYEKGLAREHSAIGHLIQVGYIFDYTFNNLKNKSQIIRDTFRRNNISYVIGILDEYVGGNYAGPQLKAYRAILEYAEKHPNTGIIIKPKKEVSIRHLHSSAEVLKLISNLESQRRVMILDSQKYPVEAGQASDIVIGMIPDSTAGLECALAGVPTVIYDIFSMRSHPFYGWGYNRVIFDDIENLLNLLDINKDRPKSIPGFADWSPVLDTIDHFRDRRASERVGFYLKTLLLKLEEGMLKEEAINTTNKVYMNEFGHDKVTSL